MRSRLASPSRRASLASASASAHVGAQTVACKIPESAGMPVAGSIT
jgi:hypothetical protein